MKLAVISLGLMALPLAAQAAPRDITPMARYCVEALVDSRPPAIPTGYGQDGIADE